LNQDSIKLVLDAEKQNLLLVNTLVKIAEAPMAGIAFVKSAEIKRKSDGQTS
jgi:hypothetical protein